MSHTDRAFRPTVSDSTNRLESREVLTVFTFMQFPHAVMTPVLHSQAATVRISVPATVTHSLASSTTNRLGASSPVTTPTGLISFFSPIQQHERTVIDSNGRQFRVALGGF